MSLQVWLPLNGNLNNQGLSNITFTGTPTWRTSGKIGASALNLSSRITFNCPELNGTKYFSICFWGMTESNPDSTANWMDLFALSDKTADGVTAGTFRFETGYGAAAYGGIHWHDNATNAIINGSYTYNTASEFGQWHHICVTVSDTQVCSYYDGVLKQTHTSGLGGGFITGAGWIGETTTRGGIQDIRIYNHALSKKEVEEISKGLVLHYKLDNNGFGQNNLLSRYVSPGQQAPGVTTTAGRTNYYGDYGIIIPAAENADTYFRLFLKEQLTQNEVYTISCNVSGLLNGSVYRFPLFAQGNTSMGVLVLDHNGLCSLTFTMTYSTQTAVTTNGETVYICFMDDSGRTIATNQGPITITNFKIEKGSAATPWIPTSTDPLYASLGLNSNIIYDSSGYQHNGDLIGTITNSISTPRYNISTHFINGSYGRIQERPSICLPTDAITVNLWIRIDTWGNPISCTEGGGWNFENSSGVQFPVYVASVGYKVANSGVTPTTLGNTWHMLTGTFDKENVKIYIDGVLKKTTATGSTNQIGYANNYLFLAAEASGNNTSPANSTFVGDLSDLRIYCVALTENQIKELYNISATIDKNGNVYAREVQEI